MKRISLIIIALLASIPSFAQRVVSADAERKEVYQGKLTTTRKHVCCSIDGRLVSFFSYPEKFYIIQDRTGSSRVYYPATNQYYTDHSGSAEGKDEIISIFLNRAVYDMGLGRYGYTLQSSHNDADGNLIRRFVTEKKEDTPIVDVVFKDYLPICVIYMSADESVRGRVYLSDYVQAGRIKLPCRQTEIIYRSPADSAVIRTIYSDLKCDSDDALLTFEIPSNAKVIKLKVKK